MKHKHILLIILSSLVCVLLMLLCAGLLYGTAVIPNKPIPSDTNIPNSLFLFQNIGRLLATGFMMLVSMAILMLLLFIFAAVYLFPPAALVLAIFFLFRHKKLGWKTLRPSIFLLLISLCCNFTWSLFVNGSGYVFHHDWRSKVYNEGYIIPHYEEKYGDTLELVEKNVIDSCNAVYTLRSGITGTLFMAETRYFDEGSGSFDKLHLYSDYQSILGERLQAGEKISLPFGDSASLQLDDGSLCWFYLYRTQAGYSLYVKGDVDLIDQKFQDKVDGKRFTISLRERTLIIEVPLESGGFSTHYIDLLPRTI